MAHWLLKTEPGVYSFQDLVRDQRTVWDGVANNLALIHVRSMKQGDLALVYHTEDERRAVGIAKVASDPYPDPAAGDPKRAVVDLAAGKPLAQPVTLAAMKANSKLAGFELFRISRLSVVPVRPAEWAEILRMAKA